MMETGEGKKLRRAVGGLGIVAAALGLAVFFGPELAAKVPGPSAWLREASSAVPLAERRTALGMVLVAAGAGIGLGAVGRAVRYDRGTWEVGLAEPDYGTALVGGAAGICGAQLSGWARTFEESARRINELGDVLSGATGQAEAMRDTIWEVYCVLGGHAGRRGGVGDTMDGSLSLALQLLADAIAGRSDRRSSSACGGGYDGHGGQE